MSSSATGLSLACVKLKPKLNSINHSDLSLVFVQPQSVAELLGSSTKLPTLKTIVALGEIPEDARKIADAWSKECGIRVFTLNEGKFALSLPHVVLA